MPPLTYLSECLYTDCGQGVRPGGEPSRRSFGDGAADSDLVEDEAGHPVHRRTHSPPAHRSATLPLGRTYGPTGPPALPVRQSPPPHGTRTTRTTRPSTPDRHGTSGLTSAVASGSPVRSAYVIRPRTSCKVRGRQPGPQQPMVDTGAHVQQYGQRPPGGGAPRSPRGSAGSTTHDTKGHKPLTFHTFHTATPHIAPVNKVNHRSSLA
jgi:hypothetical protein